MIPIKKDFFRKLFSRAAEGAEKSRALAPEGYIFHGSALVDVLKGHGFSRAADGAEKSRALAPEGKLKDGQYSVMKQLLVKPFWRSFRVPAV